MVALGAFKWYPLKLTVVKLIVLQSPKNQGYWSLSKNKQCAIYWKLLISGGCPRLQLQVSRNADQHPAFFAVYNMETTDIIAFYQVILWPSRAYQVEHASSFLSWKI